VPAIILICQHLTVVAKIKGAILFGQTVRVPLFS